MSAVNRRAVIQAHDRLLSLLRSYIDNAEPRVLAQLIGLEPALCELRDVFVSATAPERCDHVKGPHGSAQEAQCVLEAGHVGEHRWGVTDNWGAP